MARVERDEWMTVVCARCGKELARTNLPEGWAMCDCGEITHWALPSVRKRRKRR